jgi:energy-coupling factor transporter ATP-binding protein EcfA2
MSLPSLAIRNFAQIESAEVSFGDLTLLVGPQATGKSLVLQLLKLAIDGARIAGTLNRHGFGWKKREEFCAVYFGEGLAKAWTERTSVTLNSKVIEAPPVRAASDKPHLFYIPAHRTLSIAEGWPAGFRSYKPETPFVVRDFSELLLELITTKRGIEGEQVFPQKRRLKKQVRELIDEAVFHQGELRLVSEGPRRQFKLVYPGAEIGYMAWTAGQREFIPLLLGIYHLVPLGAQRKVDPIEWIVIEEPEMGLHVKAVQAVMLLILELMDRGYRVVLSTHSPTVAEVVWGLRQFQKAGAGPQSILELFDIDKQRWDVTDLAKRTLKRVFKAYHLDYRDTRNVVARDISELDPGAESESESTWGGLLSLSGRVNKVVAAAAGGEV